MLMPGRSLSASRYRYGFNGKENDNEVKGDGGQQDYGMRVYDPRVGRFLSVDPISAKYPMLTPYQFASNSPIQGIDLDGLELLALNSSMFRLSLNNESSSNNNIPLVSNQSAIKSPNVVTISSNVPKVFKDVLGVPMFTPSSVNIGPNGKDLTEEANGQPIILPSNNLPSPKSWAFSSDELEPFNGGSTLEPTWRHGKSITPTTVEDGGSLGSYTGGFTEYFKWKNMITSKAVQNAYGDLGYNKNALYEAVNSVNSVANSNPRHPFFSDPQYRTDLVNYLIDGTLPPVADLTNTQENKETVTNNIQRRINIQFLGIIMLKRMGNLNNQSVEVYKHDIDAWEKSNPGRKHNFNEPLEKTK